MARNRAYRELLTGLDDDAAGGGRRLDRDAQPDRRHARGVAARQRRPGRRGPRGDRARRGPDRRRPEPRARACGGGSWRLNLAPTPELLARVEALPPVRDHFELDLDQETQARPRLLDAAAASRSSAGPSASDCCSSSSTPSPALAGPVPGQDRASTTASRPAPRTVLWSASAAFLLVALADLLDQIAETFVTGRTSERIMLSLRIRIWAQLQRLSLDYYEREMAGRIMTRMTTDVDQFETLIENGLLQALVSLVTFVGVGVALLLMDLELGAVDADGDRAAGGRDGRSSAASPTGCTTWSASRSRSSTPTSRSRSRASARRRRSCTRSSPSSASTGSGRATTTVARWPSALIATYFPFVLFLSAIADVIVLGVGAHLIEQGRLTTGVLIAFLLYLTMFFSPIQQLSQVFDSWQQTRDLGRPHRRADAAARRSRPTPATRCRSATVRGELALHDVHFPTPQPRCVDAERARTGRRRRSADADAGTPRSRRRRCAASTCTSRAHETVALVGETGAGKSTVLKLLARFYDPDSGSVHARRPRPARRSTCTTSGSRLGYVPQESFLFTGTHPRQHRLRAARGHRRRGRGGRPRRRRPRLRRVAARRLPARDLRARDVAVVRPAAADRPGPRRAGRPGRAAPGRGDREPRPGHRGEGRRPRWRRVAATAYDDPDRPPAPDRPHGRPHRRPRPGARAGGGHARRPGRARRPVRRDVAGLRARRTS